MVSDIDWTKKTREKREKYLGKGIILVFQDSQMLLLGALREI